MSDAATLINNVQVLVGLGVTLVAGIVLQKVPFIQQNKKWILNLIAQLSTWAVALAQGHALSPTEHTVAAGVMSAGIFSVAKNLLQHVGKTIPVIQAILQVLVPPTPKPAVPKVVKRGGG